MHKLCNSWCMCVYLEVHEVCLEMPKVCTVCAKEYNKRIQQEMHAGCLRCAWNLGTKWAKYVKHTHTDQNKVNKINQDLN